MDTTTDPEHRSKLKIKQQWEEHRRSQRLIIGTKIDMAIITHPLHYWLKAPQFQGEVRNVSSTGLQLRIDTLLQVGARVKLWIPVNFKGTSHCLKLRGLVVWCKPDESSERLLIGVDLAEFPKNQMRLWTSTIFEQIRNTDTVQ